jgi:hypothetical protein
MNKKLLKGIIGLVILDNNLAESGLYGHGFPLLRHLRPKECAPACFWQTNNRTE